MVELESEGEMARGEVASFLREFANELDGGEYQGNIKNQEQEDELKPDTMTIIVGGNSATVTVPETMDFDVEVESRSPLLASGVKQGIDLELSWEVEEADDDDSIEVT